MDAVVSQEQSTLLNLESREININFVDENQPLKVYTHPLHWKAHKLQVLLARLDIQAQRNAAQFNSANYMNILNQLSELMDQINKLGATNGVLDEGKVGSGVSESGGSSEMGARKPVGVDSGISADNPFAGKRLSAA